VQADLNMLEKPGNLLNNSVIASAYECAEGGIKHDAWSQTILGKRYHALDTVLWDEDDQASCHDLDNVGVGLQGLLLKVELRE
jgi:hypothetical protein